MVPARRIAVIPRQYVWFVWSAAFLVPWIVLYVGAPGFRKPMVWSSLFTMPFGLTEPLFVPEYWSPPSLFDLAARTGFDIESLIFCFALGGVGAVLIDVLGGSDLSPVSDGERRRTRHRMHRPILAAPFLIFIALLPFPWNPIYPGIVAMVGGGVLTIWCRPDLLRSTLLGGVVFVLYYSLFLGGLELTAPVGYIEEVWNLEALSGVRMRFMPVEELLFALGFGTYWSGVYEHFNWQRRVPRCG